MTPRKILFCTDFSENSRPARALAVAYAKRFQAELLVLHVVSSRLLGYPSFENRVAVELAELDRTIDERVHEELGAVAKECLDESLEVRTFLRSGQPSVEIVRFADKQGVDLIVMGTHGWTGLAHLLLGSTAENVVRNARCPVLSVRARPKE